MAQRSSTPPALAPSLRTRRLQRDKDFTGDRLTTFREVFLRHGLPGLLLALMCLCFPHLQSLFVQGLSEGLETPVRYALAGALIFMGLNIYARVIHRRISLTNIGWMLYLGALSFWEEWVFRLALPNFFESIGATTLVAALLGAMVFGGAHYFTLRWKWQWCLAAFLGSLALSRQMEVHNDLLIITAFHWIATYINTPRPPQPRTKTDQNGTDGLEPSD